MVDNNNYEDLNKGRIINSFFMVGLNEKKITKYRDDENEVEYLQKIDIFLSNVVIKTSIFRPNKNEKWQAINKNTWLRLEYSSNYEKPITGLKILDCEVLSSEFLLINKKEIDFGYKPMIILNPSQEEKENPQVCWEFDLIEKYDENFFKVPSSFNVKNILSLNTKSPAAIIGIKRKYNAIALKDAMIITDNSGVNKIGIFANKDPFEFKYLPELIDYYPLNCGIEPSIGMLCFPEGISIKKRPDNPTWFSFIQTNVQYKKFYCSVLVFMEEMTKEHYNSFIPIYYPKEKLYVEKAICIMGNYPNFHNYKIFLRELYRMQTSNNCQIPLERIICHFVDSVFLQTEKSLVYRIGTEELKFYNQPIYGLDWDTNDDCVEILFTILSIDNITSIWGALLLERKIFFLCKSKTILNQICLALTSLLFPFKWNHVYIPVLPYKCKGCADAFVPLIMGICFSIDLDELPEDALVINLDINKIVKNNEKIPKLNDKLNKKLEKYKYKYNNPVDVLKIQYCDEVFNYCDTTEGKEKFNTQEIRNTFFDYFIFIFANFEKHFVISKKKNESGEIEPAIFNRDGFLKEHNSSDQNSFLFKFTETTIFAAFVDGFSEKETNFQLQFFIDIIKNKNRKKDKQHLTYIIPVINTNVEDICLKDVEKKLYLYPNFPKLDPKLYVKIQKPLTKYQSRFEIAKDEWCYNTNNLSNSDWSKYIVYSIHEIWFLLLSILLPTINDNVAPRLMDYAIYLIENLKNERNKITPTRSLYTKIIRSCCRSTLESYVNQIFSMMPQSYKINNPLYYSAFMNGLYDDFSQMKNKSNSTTNIFDLSIDINDQLNILMKKRTSNIFPREGNFKKNLNFLINSSIFIPYIFCGNCYKNNKIKKLNFIDILSGFKRNIDANYTICNSCYCKIHPKLFIVFENQTNLDNVEITNLISPPKLIYEIDNIIKNHGDKYFFLNEYHNNPHQREIFWNILFYFELFNLPTLVMTLQPDISKLRAAVDELKSNIENSKRFYTVNTQTSYGILKTVPETNSNPSDDNSSNITTPTANYFTNEKNLQAKIFEIFEKNFSHIENEKSEDDRKDLHNQNFHLKNVIGKYVEEFDRKQRIKFDSLFRTWEISEELESTMQMKELFDNPNIILRETKAKANSIFSHREKDEEILKSMNFTRSHTDIINIKDKK